MSFFLDIFLLDIMGIIIAYICKKRYKQHSLLVYTLSGLFLLIFYIFAIGLWCDYHMFGGVIENPTEFMYSSGIFDVPFDSFEELALPENRMWVFLGVFLFCLYPLWLYLGIMSGYLLFGRSPAQKGVLGVL